MLNGEDRTWSCMQWLGLFCVFRRCFRPPKRLSVLENKYIECCCYAFTNKCLLFCSMLQSFSGFISVGSGTDWDFKGIHHKGTDWDKRTDIGSPGTL